MGGYRRERESWYLYGENDPRSCVGVSVSPSAFGWCHVRMSGFSALESSLDLIHFPKPILPPPSFVTSPPTWLVIGAFPGPTFGSQRFSRSWSHAKAPPVLLRWTPLSSNHKLGTCENKCCLGVTNTARSLDTANHWFGETNKGEAYQLIMPSFNPDRWCHTHEQCFVFMQYYHSYVSNCWPHCLSNEWLCAMWSLFIRFCGLIKSEDNSLMECGWVT